MKEYCCVRMKNEVNKADDMDEFKCVFYEENFRRYGILINGRNSSVTATIDYCPFCGSKLPQDLCSEYWDVVLQEFGQDYYPEGSSKPKKQLPPEFHSDEWWRKRGL